MNGFWTTAIGESLGSFVGVLGALMLFWLGTRRDRRQDQERQEWELMTTLQLLIEELGHHQGALRILAKNQESDTLPERSLTTSTWDETRFTIAQSEYVDLWADLMIYFSNLKHIMWLKGLPNPFLTERLAETRQMNKDLQTRMQELVISVKGRDRRPWWKRVRRTEPSPVASDSET